MRPRRVPSSSPLRSPYVWIPDTLLTEAFHRFLRTSSALPAPSSCRSAPRACSGVPPAPALCSRRHGSNVPGPLEANRRLARRRMGATVEAYSDGGAPIEWAWGGGLGLGGWNGRSLGLDARVPTMGELMWEAPKTNERERYRREPGEDVSRHDAAHADRDTSMPQCNRLEPSSPSLISALSREWLSPTPRSQCFEELASLSGTIRQLDRIRQSYTTTDLDNDAFSHLIFQCLSREQQAGAVAWQIFNPDFLKDVDIVATVVQRTGVDERSAFFRLVMAGVRHRHLKSAIKAHAGREYEIPALFGRIEELWTRVCSPTPNVPGDTESLESASTLPLWTYDSLTYKPKPSTDRVSERIPLWKDVAQAILKRLRQRDVAPHELENWRSLVIRLHRTLWLDSEIDETFTPAMTVMDLLRKLPGMGKGSSDSAGHSAFTEQNIAQILLDLRPSVDTDFCTSFSDHLHTSDGPTKTKQAIVDKWIGVLKIADMQSQTFCSINWSAVLCVAAQHLDPLDVVIHRNGIDDSTLCRILIHRWASSCGVCLNHAQELEDTFLRSCQAAAEEVGSPPHLPYRLLLLAVKSCGIIQAHMMSDVFTLVLRTQGTSIFFQLLGDVRRSGIAVHHDQVASVLSRAGWYESSGKAGVSILKYWTEYLTAMIQNGCHSDQVFNIVRYRNYSVASLAPPGATGLAEHLGATNNSGRPSTTNKSQGTQIARQDFTPEYVQLMHDIAWPFATVSKYPYRVRLRNVFYCCQILQRRNIPIQPSLARALIHIAVHEQLARMRPVSLSMQRYIAALISNIEGEAQAVEFLASLAPYSDKLARMRNFLERMESGRFRRLVAQGRLDGLPTEYLQYILKKRILGGKMDTSRRWNDRRDGVTVGNLSRKRYGIRMHFRRSTI
ncbi:hypothetical protein P152DRAFT_452932 [Eremomyces bilateralis CBS 781.70]|uniref:Uncharacterized protein n=1 Tax=Eremomyces bilateralis CBS 781.70 TaxID=1392243 RepID=A0A6G1FRD5_9PEZI|nr:uncharacterized protein P152DRAFT_452932 [Eremomyces bilateralis CBS 781.70]KAF1808354.1 hypothetical protein P152DRAFT_452932 [Eremomyces bilateralis CBS 781.70]